LQSRWSLVAPSFNVYCAREVQDNFRDPLAEVSAVRVPHEVCFVKTFRAP